VGRNEQIQRINAAILFDNHAMQHICEKLGFQLHHSIADSLVTAEIEL
jgi:acetyltransferase